MYTNLPTVNRIMAVRKQRTEREINNKNNFAVKATLYTILDFWKPTVVHGPDKSKRVVPVKTEKIDRTDVD